jgi:hypothetical protein
LKVVLRLVAAINKRGFYEHYTISGTSTVQSG